jgi:hypothetical protein
VSERSRWKERGKVDKKKSLARIFSFFNGNVDGIIWQSPICTDGYGLRKMGCK